MTDNNFYVGFTHDLEARMMEHNAGRVQSTKHRRPFILVHKEEFETEALAIQREKYLKGKGGIKFKKELRNKIIY